MTTSLCFNDFTFSPVTRDNQPWFKSSEIASALGYKREDTLSRLYDRNADEFAGNMTQVIEISTDRQNGVMGNFGTGRARIFSLRGCHLLAMFARTPVAKAFRRWVLDVIERYGERVQPEQSATLEPYPAALDKATVEDRTPLKSLVNTWSRLSGVHQADLWPQVRAQFGIARINQLRKSQLPAALAWVQAKIDALPKPVQKELPPAKDSYTELEDRMEEARQTFLRLQRELYSGLGRLAGNTGKVPGKVLAELPDMLIPATLKFLNGGSNIHEAYSTNPVRMIREMHRAFGVKA